MTNNESMKNARGNLMARLCGAAPLLAMVGSLGFVSAASADVTDRLVEISAIEYDGTLCPKGSLPDLNDLQAFPWQLILPLDASVKNTTGRGVNKCNVTYTLKVPAGYQFKRVELFSQYVTKLQQANAGITLRYGFEGASDLQNTHASVTANGEQISSISAEQLEWSPSCKSSKIKFHVSLEADANPNINARNGSGSIEVSDLVVDFMQKWDDEWRRCGG